MDPRRSSRQIPAEFQTCGNGIGSAPAAIFLTLVGAVDDPAIENSSATEP
jgi:hypothetical protein